MLFVLIFLLSVSNNGMQQQFANSFCDESDAWYVIIVRTSC